MRNNHHNGVPQRNNNNPRVEIPLDDIDFPRNDGNPKLFMDNGFGNSQQNELGHEMAQFQQYPRRDNANRKEQILDLHSKGRGLKTIEWPWKEIIIIMIDLKSNKII